MPTIAEPPIPYLPSLEWYRDYIAFRLDTRKPMPPLPRHFCRAEVIAPFGRRCLSVPVEGGRRLITPRRYGSLTLSEHGNWRHTHWTTIESAYGSTPYFHLYENLFSEIYSRRHTTLAALCTTLHQAIDDSISLTPLVSWLSANPGTPVRRRPSISADPSLSILDLMFRDGPATIFTLLPEEYAER